MSMDRWGNATRISIHAPREGGDALGRGLLRLLTPFQSTPPARGATCGQVICTDRCFLFQSTPPARGATPDDKRIPSRPTHFNPRPPRGGRLNNNTIAMTKLYISIHAPREGGDALCMAQTLPKMIFQSTPPARGATNTSSDVKS